MLDLGWQELLVIGVLALLVVGPRELPGLARSVGRWVGKARGMAREFQRSMEDAAREADLDELKRLREVKRDVEGMAKLDFSEQAKRSQSFMGGAKTAGPSGADTGGADMPAAPPSPAPQPAATPAGPASTTGKTAAPADSAPPDRHD